MAGPLDLRARIDAFLASFNENDLDAVMEFFREDAVYRPGDGKEHRGKSAIRKAFEPQFAGAYGKMRFDEYDRFVDEGARKATLRWICRHDIQGAHGKGIPKAQRLLYKTLLRGDQAGWHGLDVFHFDENGRIIGKYSYGEAKLPLFRPELGEPL